MPRFRIQGERTQKSIAYFVEESLLKAPGETLSLTSTDEAAWVFQESLAPLNADDVQAPAIQLASKTVILCALKPLCLCPLII